ncbi:MAG: archaeal proteasome endopeptidase complex subunit alpha [Candidatus Micrarchaeota archaeon]
MYGGVSPQAYDRAITVFSPDGRLFQVEYAKEAVKRGATAIGIIARDSVALIANRSVYTKLIVSDSLKKIFDIDSHIAFTASGLIADARKLVDIGRMEAQRHRLIYNEPAPVETIARSICDIMQLYTQFGGIRPFGVSLLIAGYNSEPVLYGAEPSGAMTGFKADSIGSCKKEVDEILEKGYKENMLLDDAILVAVNALKKTSEEKLQPDNIEVSYIEGATKKFIRLSDKEILKYLK